MRRRGPALVTLVSRWASVTGREWRRGIAAAVAAVLMAVMLAAPAAAAPVAPDGDGAGFRSAANGLLVSAEYGWSGERFGVLRARASAQGPWEGWQTVDLGGGEVALESTDRGFYASVNQFGSGDNYGRLNAWVYSITDWERFRRVPLAQGRFALQSVANGLYVSTELGWSGDNYGMLRARANSIGAWEVFTDSTPAPSNLQARATDSTTTFLTWHDNSPASIRFEIDNGNMSRITDVDATTFWWTGEMPGSYMCFRIRAMSTSNSEVSRWSAWVCTTTPVPPPTDVRAVAVSSSVTHLSWRDNTNGQLPFAISNGETSRTASVGATNYDWGGQVPGQYQCFAIAAFNGGNVSTWTDWACTTTPALPAPAVSTTAISSSTTRIAWGASYGGVDHWEISNGNYSRTFSAGVSSYDWGGQSPGQYQCFSVRAVLAGGGASDWSTWSCTVTPVPAPSAIAASAINASTSRITWTDNSGGIAHFEINNGTDTRTTSAGATSFDWGGQAPGQRMCFHVRAAHDFGVSAWSNETCTVTPVPTPTAVSATATSSSTIKVTWNDVPGAGYVVNNGTTSSPDIAAGTTSYTWTGLTPRQTMCFTVAAKQNQGQSPWSPQACATTPSNLIPPILVTATAINPTTIQVSWPDPNSGTARYEVSNGITVQTSGPGATSLDWAGLTPQTRLCFRVRAVDGADYSDWQPNSPTAVCATTSPSGSTPPTPATTITAAADTSYMIHLTWADASGGAKYEVNNGAVSMFTGTGATSFDWGALNPGTTACFRIRALTGYGASSWAPSDTPSACATTTALLCQASRDVPDTNGNVDLYHGTGLAYAQDIRDHGIDVTKGERYVDFGRGFYVTTDLNQARAWAERNFGDRNPSVLHYRVPLNSLSPGGMCGLVFNPPTVDTAGYLAFIRGMRILQPTLGGAGYDFVEGPFLDNPFEFTSGSADARYLGQQDSFHTPQAIQILNQSPVEILPAVVAGQVHPYAIIGDSYSSGEGAGNYDAGTDTTTNTCHRSPNAFGRLYAVGPPTVYPADRVKHVACSGASIANLTTTGQHGETAQISAIPGDTGLVTVTVGGNDAGFAEVLTRCVTARSGTCEDYYSQDDANNLHSRIDALRQPLAAAYKAVRNRAPGARVIALTYPNVFQPGSEGRTQTGCLAIGAIADSDTEWLIRETFHLDNVIDEAAGLAGVEVLDERYAYLGHELCSSDPWVNSLLTPPITDVSKAFHPNAAGHAQLAADLATHVSKPAAVTPMTWPGWRNPTLIGRMPTYSQALQMLRQLHVDNPHTTPYLDSYFGTGWSTAGSPPGCHRRWDVLNRDIDPGTMRRVPGSTCRIQYGEWQSAYDDPAGPLATVTGDPNPPPPNQSPVDVDHVVSKKDAWVSGADLWGSWGTNINQPRIDFANDDTGLELISVSGHANNSKGERTPDQWTPDVTGNPDFTCDFMAMYVQVKWLNRLNITAAQYLAINPRLRACLAAGGGGGGPVAPAAEWAANEGSGTTLRDAWGNQNPITLTAGTSWTDGRAGGSDKAVSFDGATGTGSTAGPVVRTDRSFSVAAWVRYTATGGWRTAVSAVGDHVSAFYLQCGGDTNTWKAVMPASDVDGPANVNATSNRPCRPGVWTHLAMTYDDSNRQIRLYVNGTLAAQVTRATPWNASGPLVIGSAKWDSHPVDFWSGQMDDVRVWNRPVGAQELVDMGATSLVGGWSANEGTGATVADQSGRQQTIALSGGTSWAEGRAGGSDKAVSFDGTTSTGSTAGPVVRTDRSFSVAAWVRYTATGDWRTAISATGNHVSAFYLQCSAGNTWRVAMTKTDVNGPGIDEAVSSQPCRANVWTHLAMTFNADSHEVKLYLNGALTAQAAHATVWNATGPLTIGSAKWDSHPVDFWAGQIDDIRIWDRPVDAQELVDITNAITPVGSWNLDGSGTDGSPYGHPVTLSAGATWTTGHAGDAASFDGVAAYGTTTAPVVHTDQSFSVAAWVRLSRAPTGWVTAVSQNGVTNSSFVLGSDGGKWAFALHGADAVGTPAYRVFSSQPIQIGVWIHLAGVYDASTRQMRLYVNGSPVASMDNVVPYDSRSTVDIGRARWENGWRDWWPGDIDDVRVLLGNCQTME